MRTVWHPIVSDPVVDRFLAILRADGFEGDVASDMASRLTAATDNSIYQVTPLVVLYPRSGRDLNRIVLASRETPGGPLPLSARGGGTGTNGQSLTRGVVVDVSMHMDRIVSLDVDAGLVVVQPGVVLNQLSHHLAAHGLFFPPTVSTASRATIGGMVATDASGKGSRIYGKTSDYVVSLDVVLSDGTDMTVGRLDRDALRRFMQADGLIGDIHREAFRIVTENADLIGKTFPAMNRGLTGYNLKEVLRDDAFDLTYLLAGSEGTLALTRQVTLRVVRRPSCRALVVARYASFDTALRDVRHVLAAEPSAIEILDDRILALASGDAAMGDLEGVMRGTAGRPVLGLNFIEFLADDREALDRATDEALRILERSPHRAMDWTLLGEPAVIDRLWSLRKDAVGLLGRMAGRRQGTAFIEDTAVPPEVLADYVADLRAILDRHGLRYGMFGHADVGCLHVRPAMDMTDRRDAALIRDISDEVAGLAKAYGGLLWGEHGRGYRGEYSPFFFGPELYRELCRLKRAFDPRNIFNPGKLAAPDEDGRIDRIDGVPRRGDFDREIDRVFAGRFAGAIACNGNGACHAWDASEVMCPSYRATRDRVQSPKGRAAVLREWSRLRSNEDRGRAPDRSVREFEEQVKATLDTCLACKACSSRCPVKVDIPAMKARFLQDYHRTRKRPWRDHVMARMEAALPLARLLPGATNAVLANPLTARFVRNGLGLVDLPRVSSGRTPGGRPAVPLRRGTDTGDTVILIRDSFVSTFDAVVVDAARRLLNHCGYEVVLSPVIRTGKAEHVLGFLDRFGRTAERANGMLSRLGSSKHPMISLDAATGLLFEAEYAEFAPERVAPRVSPMDEFLAGAIDAGRIPSRPSSGEPSFQVLLHCTERTARPGTAERWREVLAHFGIASGVPALGCCGMAGMFGHETEHAGMSKRIFDGGWGPRLAGQDPRRQLATGFSCRCQVGRFAGFRPRHPIEAILALFESEG